jgi:acyl phosphate:glycerol-3-phosphate acyltransferase
MIEFITTYYPILAIPLGYLLGSVSGSYIIGRYLGKFDIRTEPDGRVSAATIYRKLGRTAFLLAITIDVCKGLIAVLIARYTSDSLPFSVPIVLATCFMAVAGHNWSWFLKFKGGLGATVTFGALGGVFFYQELIAFVPGLLFLAFTKKSGISTGIIIGSLTLVLLIQKLTGWHTYPQDMTWYVILEPVFVICLMLAKKLQLKWERRTPPAQ